MPPAAQTFDIEEVVTNWAWQQYDRTASWRQKRFRLKHKAKGKKGGYISIEIDWSDVKFEDETDWSTCGQVPFETFSNESNCNIKTKEHSQAASKFSHENVLFQTKFTNNTDNDQEYTVRTEKTTSSTSSTTIETGFTKGIDMSITLRAPSELLEASVGYHREMSLTKSEGETLEESLTWGVESVIIVKPRHVAEAQLVVNERKSKGAFTITTRVHGMVYVSFYKVSKGTMIKCTGHYIGDIISEFLEMRKRIRQPLEYVEVQDSTVVIHTKGSCKFRYGINQEVKVFQEPLDRASTP